MTLKTANSESFNVHYPTWDKLAAWSVLKLLSSTSAWYSWLQLALEAKTVAGSASACVAGEWPSLAWWTASHTAALVPRTRSSQPFMTVSVPCIRTTRYSGIMCPSSSHNSSANVMPAVDSLARQPIVCAVFIS
ncbi:hypothetical protein ElyMa_001352300 [Elysia marginata]|uniref:Uncharacterized protein n=1 Tax=Elysia marginata TaxID=1093978 RepID=A0AAV4IP85_9GAST|nr:hypothetical protein ElyMa_001352300 [Elysia marginata]